MCKGSTAKAAHTLVCSWRKYSCRPCKWRLQPSHNHQYLSSLCCQCCHCRDMDTRALALPPNQIISLPWQPTEGHFHLNSASQHMTFCHIHLSPIFQYKPLSSPFTSVLFHLPKMTCSHVHQPLTNWTSTSLLSLSPSNALTFITTTTTNFRHHGMPHKNHRKQ